MPYYSGIILNSFYNQLFPKLFQHNRRMPTYHSPCTANCAGSTLSKHNTRLTHIAHCAGSSANTIQNSHAQDTALAVVQTHMHITQD